jgi:hypothetical protein
MLGDRDHSEGKVMTSSDTSTAQCRHVLLISGALVSLLALVIAGVTFLYVSGERFFYCWDYSGYQDLTIDLATSFRDSPTEAVDRVRRSLGDDYPQVVIVPLVPFMLAAGGHESRMVYVQSLALMYLLPFTLVMGAIAVTLLPLCPRWVLGSTAALTLLIPMAWVPTLRGSPDTAGALLIALAVLIYVQDIDLKHWWRVPLIGFLVAAAMLLRRHFAYSGIAFMMAVALQALITFLVQVRQHGRRALSDVLSSALRIGLMGTSALVTLAVLGWAFVQNVLGHDFAALYAS